MALEINVHLSEQHARGATFPISLLVCEKNEKNEKNLVLARWPRRETGGNDRIINSVPSTRMKT